jgi:hypothetical protein
MANNEPRRKRPIRDGKVVGSALQPSARELSEALAWLESMPEDDDLAPGETEAVFLPPRRPKE